MRHEQNIEFDQFTHGLTTNWPTLRHCWFPRGNRTAKLALGPVSRHCLSIDGVAMTKRPIDCNAIRALATPDSYTRGRQYRRDGAVGEAVRRGDEVSAHVEGNDIDPYRVRIRLNDGGVADAKCSCPYDWGGYCKHIIAVLMTLAEHPDAVVERAPIAELLAALDKSQLMGLLERRLAIDDALAGWIELELATLTEDPGPGPQERKKRRTEVDPSPFREHANLLMRERYRGNRYWDERRSTGDHDELEQLVAKAVPFLENGDGRNAIRVLEAITDEFVDGWIEEAYVNDEDMYLLFDDFARMIAEAALMSDLEADERDALRDRVEDWHERLAEYGVDDAFPLAIRALETRWDDPALADVLTGKARKWPPAGRADETEASLTAVRLRVLEGANRSDEYLRLSKATGAHVEHAGMLARLKRVAEAVSFGRKHFKAPSEALELAKVLREIGDDAAALDIAGNGLDLKGELPGQLQRSDRFDYSSGPYGIVSLADWLRDYAGGLGKPRIALKATRVAFGQTHTLEDFRAAETWAKAKGSGASWSKVRAALFGDLAKARHAHDRTLIYLEEGLIDEAVQSAGEPSDDNSDTDTLMRLAEAAAASHSDWVVRFTVGKASAIMDDKRASHYEKAAKWLEKAVLAFEASGREDDWVHLLDSLIEKHRRKHKLRPLLEALR